MGIKVAIHIVGLNRSLSFTASSISRRVIKPLTRVPGISLEVNLVLIVPDGPISNPRSAEHGSVESEVPVELVGVLRHDLKQDELVTSTHVVAQRAIAKGDVFLDGGASVVNALCYLEALRLVAEANPGPSDVTLVLRPDVRIEGPMGVVPRVLWLAFRSKIGRPILLLPAWGNYGGYNDRFAMMSGQIADTYMRRGERISSWLRDVGPFDPERFLAFCMRGVSVRRSIYAPMYRVRIGGRAEEADFLFFEKKAWVRRLRDIGIRGLNACRRGVLGGTHFLAQVLRRRGG